MKKELIIEDIRNQMKQLLAIRRALGDIQVEINNSPLVGQTTMTLEFLDAADTALLGTSQVLVSALSLLERCKEYAEGTVLEEWKFDED